MSRDWENSSSDSRTPPAQNDARVEILLFLGIVFWCWMLVLFYQGKVAVNPERFLTLYWDGKALQTKEIQVGAAEEQDAISKTASADVTPFLFQPIPINFAGTELLATISGIGPELSAQIVKTRDNKGFFTQAEDLLTVPGIGRSRMNQFASQFSFTVSQ
jgi:competence ComEA-like helix-hairpin-helix protein